MGQKPRTEAPWWATLPGAYETPAVRPASREELAGRTVAELRELLDRLEVDYPARARKAQLAELAYENGGA